MKTRALGALAALALAATPAALRAQAAAADPSQPAVSADAGMRPLSIGDPIRLMSTSGTYAGTLAKLGVDTVTVAAQGRNVSVLRANVRAVQRVTNRNTRGRYMRRGALLGVGSGLALGFLVGELAGHGDPNALGAFTAEGAILGALTGTMVGPSFRHDEWERVDLPPSPAATASASTVAAAPRS